MPCVNGMPSSTRRWSSSCCQTRDVTGRPTCPATVPTRSDMSKPSTTTCARRSPGGLSRVDSCLRCAGEAAWPLLIVHGLYAEARAWLVDVFELDELTPRTDGGGSNTVGDHVEVIAAADRAFVVDGIAVFAGHQGDYEEARSRHV